MPNNCCFLPKNKDRKFVTLKGNVLKTNEKESYKKKGIFYSGFLDSKSLIHTPIDVEKAVPIDTLDDYVITKSYEELGLDFNSEYIVKYIKKDLQFSHEYDEYDVFVVSREAIEKRFEYVLEQNIKHIDYITLSPFLFKSLYRANILPIDKTHCFAYIGYGDSFLTLYQNGKFKYVKSMEFSLEELFKRFSFTHPNVLNLQEFLTILENDDEKYQEGIDKIYNDIGSYIADILLYIKRVYDVEVDNFYIDCDIKINDVFFKYISSYMDVKPEKFEFDCKFVGESISHLTKLTLLSSLYFNELDDINFTIYEKEKAFIYKDSGKLILTVAGSFLLSMLYPIFNLSYSYIIDFQIDSANKLLLRHQALANEYKMLFRVLDAKKQEFLDKKSASIQNIKDVKELMLKIQNKKSKYTLKIKKLVEILKVFSKFDVKTLNISITSDGILTILSVSKNEDEITKFIKTINSDYEVDVKKISLENSVYVSEVIIKELKDDRAIR